MYKNVIFDIGNVLLYFKPIEFLHTKIADPKKVAEVYEEVFLSEEWIMLDRGTITEKDTIEVLCGRSKENGELVRLAFDNWYEILTPITETVEILKSLKNARVKVYYLSNFHHLAFENVIGRYEFFKLFDGGVVSYKEKLVKPEIEIYDKILREFDLDTAETIFIDDTKVNIEGAEKAGIKGILFTGAEDLSKKLHECQIQF